MKRILSVIIAVVLCISVLSLCASRVEAKKRICKLPAGAKATDPSIDQLDVTRLLIDINFDGPGRSAHVDARARPEYTTITASILHSLDLNPSVTGNQQTVFVRQGGIITVKGKYQIYNPPGMIVQAFFIYSWTPI